MKSICYVDIVGTKRWYQETEINSFYTDHLHREDGPAVEWSDGSKEWWINGKLHREDGPTYEGINGHKEWYLNDLRHREDGPAVEFKDGSKEWWLNGKRHREDGPAYEGVNGDKEWYYHDKHIDCKDNQEFLRIVKLMVFL